MPLARDPDTLRVPAFMRKRSLSARLKKPLVLTALDRKKAGITVVKKGESFTKPVAPKRLLCASRITRNDKTARNDKTIGVITHYYDKIKVGVIKLSGGLAVGDCITYKTDEGPYKQVVESMEIDREPVFKAGRGKEIGMKLRKIPRIGGTVLK